MKQVFEANTKLRRVICAVLVAIMVIGMIPLAAPKAAALSKGDKLYFDANHWDTGNAWFAAYFFGNGTTYVTMKDSNDDGVYVCDVPGSYSSVIFLRMDPSVSTPSFDNGMWNKTADLTPGSNNFFAPSNNGWTGTGGTWSSYTCTHSGHGQNGVCTNCESTNVHKYVNGSCSCGVVDPSFNPTFYLVGSINGEDYGIEDDHENLGSYKFVDGTLTAIFTAKTDVMIKTNTNKWYMTKTYVKENTATFYNCADYPDEAKQKMNIPVGVEVTFTLTENADGTLTLSYTTGACLHLSHNTSGICTVCGENVAHTFSDATCTAPKTCSVCGVTEGDALGHSWKDATCTAPKTCSVCGAKEGSTAEHTYRDATCTAPKTCSVCGATTGSALGHNPDPSTGTCSRCGDKVSNVGNVVNLDSGTFNKDEDKLYVGSIFYDYYSDWEMDGKNLDNNEGYTKGDDWYIFDDFNAYLSEYYRTNKAKVPIYMGHFQPDWKDNNNNPWGWQFKDHGDRKYSLSSLDGSDRDLWGFMDGNAYGTTSTDQKWFMSVNNSNMDIDPDLGHVYQAAWGIVHEELRDGVLLDGGGSVVQPLFNADFLLGDNFRKQKIADVYYGVQFPFTKKADDNGIQYWVFDSLETTLEMKKDTASNLYYLDEVVNPSGRYKNMDSDGNVKSEPGFFPFNAHSSSSNVNTYNYGFGTRLDIPFNLTSDGKIADKYGDKHDIVYEFSGDDDVWVFIDGQLVLDIGGSHGRVEGSINFATKTTTVSGVKKSGGNHTAEGTNKTSSFTLDYMAGEHTLTMFYMERGMWESNMKISFNFIPKSSMWAPTTSFSVMKQWNVADTNVIPSSVTVQLQRRLQGATDWAMVENKTLTSANQSVQRVDNVWVYTWENLPNFEGETLYEYRVVELDNNNNVLSNGKQNGNTMVAYGDVAGSGATGYTQIISNNQVANPVVVVIDFGLSVDVHVNTQGTLEGVGNTLKLPVGTKDYKDENVVSSVEGKHGVATVVNGVVRYTPNNMMMDSADNIGFCVNMGNGNYNYSTLTVIPAANIYYEDNFLNFSHATNATSTMGKWVIEGTASDKIQAEDRPGNLNANDANNVYGYDQAYDNFTLYSLGSARKVTVDANTGKPASAPTATFSFTGTGFDVVSLTDNKSGCIVVEVRQNNSIVKNYIVNNYYGMFFNTATGEWDHATDADKYHLYQVPVIKVEGLNYGTYDVTIKAAYMRSMDMANAGSYTIWVDAIRIYNPAQNDQTSNGAYNDDGESNPHLTTVKKLLTTPGNFGEGYGANGVMYVEGKSAGVTMAEYKNQGPNNETYLMNGNAIAFKLRYNGNATPNVALQIGAKLAEGDQATLVFNGDDLTTLSTATNMFYKLNGITWTQPAGKSYYESDAIVLSCKAEKGNILSLTDLKMTGADAEVIWDYYNPDPVQPAMFMSVVDNDVFNYAVNVMTGVEVNPVTLTGNSFSLSFEDEILVNYYYAISDVTNVTEHGMLVFNTDPGVADIAKADQKYDAPVYVESDNLYACTTTGIAAKEMGDSRYYCAYAKLADGTIVYSDLNQYSPKHYAMSRLENSENENLKALCVAMLNYGAAAQSYFGYKTDALMNADLTDAQKALVGEYNADLFTGAVAADPAKVNSCFAATEAGFQQKSASVSFDGAFALNFYFDLDRENSEVVFYYWTKEAYESADELSDTNCTGSIVAAADANGIFHAPITGIAAKDLDDTIYIAATYTIDGETFCSGVIAYSLSTYCMRHANGNMGQLAQATAMYGYYAENYFSVSSQETI